MRLWHDGQPAERGQISRYDGCNLWISPGGLATALQHDRHPGGGHLDRPRCDTIGGHVDAWGIIDRRALEPHPDAVGIGRHRVLAVEEGLDPAIREMIALRPQGGAEPRRPAEIEPLEPAFVAI